MEDHQAASDDGAPARLALEIIEPTKWAKFERGCSVNSLIMYLAQMRLWHMLYAWQAKPIESAPIS
jgi:hypothetical protein